LPPNVLLLMADQLAASWLPAYGHGIVSSPNLDALAGAGAVFESAYCPSPLCAPARAALLTGRLPSRIGVFDNAAELKASEPTVMHRLRAAGYDTCLSGKMHFVGPDQLHGFEQRLTTDVYPADLDWTPDWRVPPSRRLPWYHTLESVLTPEACAASMQMDYDDEVAHRAVRKLRRLAREPARPFFLCVSFTNPHDPWELRPEYWDRYDAAAIDLPAVGPLPRERADPHSLRLRDMSGLDDVELDDDQVRRARHGYYAAISYLDDRVGDVLRALDETGLREDTIVLFTADHGELLGERGLWYKMAFFEQSARVPLIAAGPGIEPRRIAEPVSLLDLAPTLLDLCGTAPAVGLDGRSLAPALAGADPDPADVVVEYLAEGVTAPAVMLRRGRHKLIVCPGDPDQLYDLEADPRELADIAAAEPAVRAELRAALDARYDLDALRAEILRSQDERRVVVAGLNAGRPASWTFVAEPDAGFVGGKDDLYEFQRRARLESRAAGEQSRTGR
jgi:choline-sulfatase